MREAGEQRRVTPAGMVEALHGEERAVERVAAARAEASSRKQGPHTADGAVEAIGQSASHLVRRLMRKGSALKITIRLGESRCAFGHARAQMPEDTTADDRGQRDLVGETAAVVFI